jgi:hypothetical protein
MLPVRVRSVETGKSVDTYALLDSGSNVTLCQDQLLKVLGAKGRREPMQLTTLEKAGSVTMTQVVQLSVSSLDGEVSLDLPDVRSRPDLHLSPENIVTEDEVERWPHLRGLPLHPAHPREVMLLIGQDCPEALMPRTTVAGGRGEPYAVKTLLGWTVTGPVSDQRTQSAVDHSSLESTDEPQPKVYTLFTAQEAVEGQLDPVDEPQVADAPGAGEVSTDQTEESRSDSE